MTSGGYWQFHNDQHLPHFPILNTSRPHTKYLKFDT